MNETKSEDLILELKRITKLLVVLVTKEKSQKERIEILSGIGFQPKEIAELLNTTSNTVSVTLNALKKKK